MLFNILDAKKTEKEKIFLNLYTIKFNYIMDFKEIFKHVTSTYRKVK